MESEQLHSPTTVRSLNRRLRGRYSRVTLFFARVVIGVLWWDVILRRLGLKRLSRRTAPRRYRRIALGFGALVWCLGGVWIKVGQFLSARLDVLPEAAG